jgi:hypothetical protein
MNAETIALALGGRRTGRTWMACCPAHDDREPSLAIRDADNGKVLLRCHAACSQKAVIAELRARGLWGEERKGRNHSTALSSIVPDHDAPRRTDVALALWQATVPAAGTIVEIYLASRGLTLQLPATIRFHARLRHPTAGVWPAMVALVTRGVDGKAIAIHRTFLTRDGSAKAPVVPQKMMLGPCRGGAVRLGTPSDVLMLGEGIENCLAAAQATGYPAWAGLSTAGLRSLDLPHDIQNLIVLADGDDPGEAAACDCARRLRNEGRRVRIARPPRGMDFNALLLDRAHSDVGRRP